MKNAAEFRLSARNVLRGKWGIAVLAGLIASLLGGIASQDSGVKLNIDLSEGNVSFDYAGQTIISTGGGLNPEVKALIVGGTIYIALLAIAMAVIYFVLSSVIKIGYARFNLNLAGEQEVSLNSLFAYFSYWKTAAVLHFLQGLYILLWSLLFFIPGIVASYSYAMTGYLLAEYPEMTASEALRRSKELMSGNRWRLFCLQFSFIGWDILSSFTLGIGNLWLIPYKQAAEAEFYREISGSNF